jgi:hypothetical protein
MGSGDEHKTLMFVQAFRTALPGMATKRLRASRKRM